MGTAHAILYVNTIATILWLEQPSQDRIFRTVIRNLLQETLRFVCSVLVKPIAQLL